jgi:hypothetical protein
LSRAQPGIEFLSQHQQLKWLVLFLTTGLGLPSVFIALKPSKTENSRGLMKLSPGAQSENLGFVLLYGSRPTNTPKKFLVD